MTFRYHKEPSPPFVMAPWRKGHGHHVGTMLWAWSTKRRALQRAHSNRLKRRRLKGDL